MKEFILNERKYVEECLATGKIDKNPRRTLTLLSRYYYHVKKIRKIGLAPLMVDFLAKYYPMYEHNKKSWNETCEKIASSTGKEQLKEIEGVWITKPELETIAKINNKILERLAFTMLCIAKLNNARNDKNNNWVNENLKDVFDAAHVTGSKTRREIVMHELLTMGLIKTPKRNDKLNICVLFLDDAGEKELFVSDFRELGYCYMAYCGTNFKRCKNCGKLIRIYEVCNECEKKQAKTRNVTCIDCGKVFEIDARVVNKCRCDDCQRAKVRKDNAERMRRQRERAAEGHEAFSKTDNESFDR